MIILFSTLNEIMGLGSLDAKIIRLNMSGILQYGWFRPISFEPLINLNIPKSGMDSYYMLPDATHSTTFKIFLPKNLNLNLVKALIN